ncbi:MAG TPA: hypothetical protein VI953_02160 [Candidatus Paceibacterota bacterium]
MNQAEALQTTPVVRDGRFVRPNNAPSPAPRPEPDLVERPAREPITQVLKFTSLDERGKAVAEEYDFATNFEPYCSEGPGTLTTVFNPLWGQNNPGLGETWECEQASGPHKRYRARILVGWTIDVRPIRCLERARPALTTFTLVPAPDTRADELAVAAGLAKLPKRFREGGKKARKARKGGAK